MTQQRPFSEIIGDIYAEYEAHSGLYDPVRGIHVPPLEEPEYSVTPTPLTEQEGTALRFSMGAHGDGGPIYTVRPNEIGFNPGRALTEGDDFYVYDPNDEERLTDTATASELLRLLRGAHQYAQSFKRS